MAAARRALAIILMLAIGGLAQAQVLHRKNVPAGDATPEGGSFSIRFPTAFNDVEVKANDQGAPALFMLTGADGDHIRFSATEAPMTGPQPKPMDDFMSGLREQSGGTVVDMHRETDGGRETLSFALNVSNGGYFFRMIRTNNVQYMQVVQFPETARDKAAKMKDDFFGSFKLNQP